MLKHFDNLISLSFIFINLIVCAAISSVFISVYRIRANIFITTIRNTNENLQRVESIFNSRTELSVMAV